MASLSINSYNRRDSFGLGWADQWDYKFNDEKIKANSSSSASSRKPLYPLSSSSPFTKSGKENNPSSFSSSSSQQSRNLLQKSPFGSKKLADINRKVLSAANSSAVLAKSAANSSAHKVKASTSMGIKWLKKQCSMKTLK